MITRPWPYMVKTTWCTWPDEHDHTTITTWKKTTQPHDQTATHDHMMHLTTLWFSDCCFSYIFKGYLMLNLTPPLRFNETWKYNVQGTRPYAIHWASVPGQGWADPRGDNVISELELALFDINADIFQILLFNIDIFNFFISIDIFQNFPKS